MATGKPSRQRQLQLDEIIRALPARISELAMIFLRRAAPTVSRTDISVMQRLSAGPQRITDLAAAELVKQPGITLVVNRLQERAWVTRRSDPSDGRVVLVALTDDGRAALRALEDGYTEMLSSHMADLDDAAIDALARAVQILDELTDRLKRETP